MNSFPDQRGSENWPTSSLLHNHCSHLNSLPFSFKAKESYICRDLVFICSQWGLLFWWRDRCDYSLQLPSFYLNSCCPAEQDLLFAFLLAGWRVTHAWQRMREWEVENGGW